MLALVLVLAVLGGALVLLVALLVAGWRPAGPGTKRDVAVADALLDGVLDLYSLHEVGRMLAAALDLDQLLTGTLKRVADAIRAESYALFVLDPEKNTLAAKSLGGPAAESLTHVTLGLAEGVAGEVCRARAARAHAGTEPLPWRDTPACVRSVYALPLIGRERVLGALLLYAPSPSAFDESGRRAYLGAVGKQLGVALDNALLHSRATEMSYQDRLTGLFNRRYLEEALDREVRRAERYGLPLSLNMVDIDYFKAYNDTHGHSRGDEVLRIVAERLHSQTRSADIVTRYGGEEFALILPMTTKPRARLVGEKLRAAIAALKTESGEDSIGLTISVGVATFPEDGTTAAALLEAADAALYDAKARGRNRVEVFARDEEPQR